MLILRRFNRFLGFLTKNPYKIGIHRSSAISSILTPFQPILWSTTFRTYSLTTLLSKESDITENKEIHNFAISDAPVSDSEEFTKLYAASVEKPDHDNFYKLGKFLLRNQQILTRDQVMSSFLLMIWYNYNFFQASDVSWRTMLKLFNEINKRDGSRWAYVHILTCLNILSWGPIKPGFNDFVSHQLIPIIQNMYSPNKFSEIAKRLRPMCDISNTTLAAEFYLHRSFINLLEIAPKSVKFADVCMIVQGVKHFSGRNEIANNIRAYLTTLEWECDLPPSQTLSWAVTALTCWRRFDGDAYKAGFDRLMTIIEDRRSELNRHALAACMGAMGHVEFASDEQRRLIRLLIDGIKRDTGYQWTLKMYDLIGVMGRNKEEIELIEQLTEALSNERIGTGECLKNFIDIALRLPPTSSAGNQFKTKIIEVCSKFGDKNVIPMWLNLAGAFHAVGRASISEEFDMDFALFVIRFLYAQIKCKRSQLPPYVVHLFLSGFKVVASLKEVPPEIYEIMDRVHESMMKIEKPFSSEQLGFAISGLCRLNPAIPQVKKVLSELPRLIGEVENPRLFLDNLQYMSSEHEEVRNLIRVILRKVKISEAKLDVKYFAQVISTMDKFDSKYDEIRELIEAINDGFSGAISFVCDCPRSDIIVAMKGLKLMSGREAEKLVRLLGMTLNNSDVPLTIEEKNDISFHLSHFPPDLVQDILTLKVKFTGIKRAIFFAAHGFTKNSIPAEHKIYWRMLGENVGSENVFKRCERNLPTYVDTLDWNDIAFIMQSIQYLTADRCRDVLKSLAKRITTLKVDAENLDALIYTVRVCCKLDGNEAKAYIQGELAKHLKSIKAQSLERYGRILGVESLSHCDVLSPLRPELLKIVTQIYDAYPNKPLSQILDSAATLACFDLSNEKDGKQILARLNLLYDELKVNQDELPIGRPIVGFLRKLRPYIEDGYPYVEEILNILTQKVSNGSSIPINIAESILDSLPIFLNSKVAVENLLHAIAMKIPVNDRPQFQAAIDEYSHALLVMGDDGKDLGRHVTKELKYCLHKSKFTASGLIQATNRLNDILDMSSKLNIPINIEPSLVASALCAFSNYDEYSFAGRNQRQTLQTLCKLLKLNENIAWEIVDILRVLEELKNLNNGRIALEITKSLFHIFVKTNWSTEDRQYISSNKEAIKHIFENSNKETRKLRIRDTFYRAFEKIWVGPMGTGNENRPIANKDRKNIGIEHVAEGDKK